MIVSVFNHFKILLSDRSIPFDVTFFSILLILLPIVLITGPALPDIFLSLIATYFLVKSIWKKKWKYYNNKIVYGFLIFSFFGIIRSFLSDMPFDSLMNEGSLFYFRYIFFGMGVWYLLDNNPHISTCLMYVSIISILVVSADALFQYFNGLNLLGNSKPNPHRLTGLFGHEPIVGRYIAYLSLFTFALIYQNFKRSKKIIIFSVSFLVVTEIVVFLSGERAPFFYLILFSVFLFIFNPNYRVYRLLGLLVSISIIYGIFFINSNAKTRVIDLTIKQLNQTQFPFLPYSDHHEEHYISGLKMFVDKPLFGIGTNLFRNKCEYKIYIYKDRSCNTHPHHYYIQTLAELGIFGFSFILIFFLYLSFNLLKQFFYYMRSNTHKKIPFEYLQFHILLFIFWWPIIPHMSLYNNWNNVLMMLPLGYFMKYLYENRINGNTS